MRMLSKKLWLSEGGHVHWCPGCQFLHLIPNRWDFNGNIDNPTFSPSVLHTYTFGPERKDRRCHYFLRDGQLSFCADSTHPLAGQTVPLPDLPDDEED